MLLWYDLMVVKGRAMEKIKKIIGNHPEFFTILGLSIIFYFLFFHNIWSYALMDVDESRYVSMSKDMFNSKDFLTLYLNKEFFFEKPPLYFWSECLSFALWGKITEATARFPVALYGALSCFMIYFLGRKIVSRAYGVISALILGTSLEFLILAKFAILDIVLAACITFSLSFGILTYYVKDSNKKYMWWLFYIFSGLAVLAKGIPGFVIPFGSMFFISIYAKNFKEIFKPQYFIIGFILFFGITLPWHIIMLNMHDPLFFNEYIMKHHVSRFLGSSELGRQQPFYFYLLTILWGFFPWIVSTLTVFIRKLCIKDFSFRGENDTQKLMIFAGIIAIFTLLFFSSSKTKLITYILPIYPALALLGGYIWHNYIKNGEYSRFINTTVYIISAIFTLAGIAAIFTSFYLPEQLNTDISPAKPLCITLLLLTGILSVIFVKKQKYENVFTVYVLFMVFLSAFGTGLFFNIDYKFGQDDLMKYARIAKEKNKTITCYKFTHKYSLIYYRDGDKPVVYGGDYDINDLKNALNTKDNYVIIKKKQIDSDIEKLRYNIVSDGRRYLLIEGKQ